MKVVENVTIEKLYTEMEPKLLSIARGVLRRSGPILAEASDLLNEAFAMGFIERWMSSFDYDACPEHIKSKKRKAEVDIAEIGDDWTAAQVAEFYASADRATSIDESSEYEALKFWISWKFRYFCGDEMRRKVQRPTLNLDYNRGKEGKAVKVHSVQLEETFDVAVHEKRGCYGTGIESQDDEPAEVLEYCSDMEADVLHRMYWLGQTRAFIAQIYNCHPNTISAIRKSAEEKIRNAIN